MYVEIIFLSLLIPWEIYNQKTMVALIVLLLFIYNAFKIKKGYSLVLLSIVLCIPNTSGADDENISYIFSYLFHIIRIGILLVFIHQYCNLKIKNNIIPRQLKSIIILFICLNFFYAIAFDDFNFLINGCIYYPITTYIFFYITYNDKISIEVSKKLFDILFAIFFCYVILEFLFNITPYRFLYSNFLNISYIGRAMGLLGHPLIVSCVVLLYEGFLLYRLTKKEKITIQIILCVICGILTVSRTTYVLGLLEILFWILLNKKYKSFSFYFWFIVTAIGAIWIISNTMSDYINDVLYRFKYDNVNQRLGAFDITTKLLSKHPLGCGLDFFSQIRKDGLGNSLFSDDFGTFDNYFLTQLAIYGYLGIIVYIYDFYFVFKIMLSWKTSKKLFPHIMLLFIMRFMMSFSFDVQAYMIFNMIFYYTLAFIFKYEKLSLNSNVS